MGIQKSYTLTENENQARFDRQVMPELMENAGRLEAQAHPKAVVLGGQPGSGKSKMLEQCEKEFSKKGGCLVINGDDLRAYHPSHLLLLKANDKTAANHTAIDSGKWVEKALDAAIKGRYNIVIEGTMRQAVIVEKTLNKLKAAGYETEARVLAVNSKLSEQGIALRYESMKARDKDGVGRFTPKEAHDAAYHAAPATIDYVEKNRLADKITIRNRNDEIVYSNELKVNGWAKEPRAQQAMMQERERPLTLQEHQNYAARADELVSLVKRPERQADPETIANAELMQKQGREALATD